MITETNGIKEVYFEFNDVALDRSNWYHFVLNGSVSGLSSSSTVAWKHGWPDNVYRTGLDLDFEELLTSPYHVYYIGAEI
jgi:hypothetical protein